VSDERVGIGDKCVGMTDKRVMKNSLINKNFLPGINLFNKYFANLNRNGLH
jgi:hypothetical protein